MRNDIFHPLIQGIDPWIIIPIAPSQHIPALFEKFQTVGVQDEGTLFILPETLVSHFDGHLVPHGVHDDRKPLLAGGDLLKEDPVAHVGTLVQQVVHGQGLQQPLADAVALQVIGVGDVVPQRPVALDLDSEGVQDGLPVVMEGALIKLFAGLVQWRILPKVAELLPGDVSVAVDGVNQPNIPVEIVLCHILLSLFSF